MGQQQREIKFRAWDKVFKKMYHPDGNQPSPIFYLNGCLAIDQSWVTGDFVLLQYTGLKDGEGKEVYEGDIIEAKNFAPERYVVEFIQGAFCLNHPKMKGYAMDINLMYPSTGCMFKIIGNIQENPELLNQ
jgi:uncharacterized phage protein (TIGR01671 family)